jgi:hypothetical protein
MNGPSTPGPGLTVGVSDLQEATAEAMMEDSHAGSPKIPVVLSEKCPK